MPTFSEDLAFRGLIHQVTDPALPKRLDAGGLTVYAGFDPTADSLHVGSMLLLCTLRRFQLAGHRTITLAGGGTGMIGDPGGKLDERVLLTREVLDGYLAGIRPQLAQFLDLSDGLLLDNSAWLDQLSTLDFLRDVGKHFTVNQMVAKESVKARFERPDQGISYTEFSYMLLQAYDFMRLHVDHGCDLQIGGSDQWGNITMGVDYIRKVCQDEVWGLTTPLVLKPDGTKYGKTETGTVWLDPVRTSPFAMYQFFLNTADAMVGTYLRFFTFLSHEEIEALDAETAGRIPSGGRRNGRWPGPSCRSCTARRRCPDAKRLRRRCSVRRSPRSARTCCWRSPRMRRPPRSRASPSPTASPSSTRWRAVDWSRRGARRAAPSTRVGPTSTTGVSPTAGACSVPMTCCTAATSCCARDGAMSTSCAPPASPMNKRTLAVALTILLGVGAASCAGEDQTGSASHRMSVWVKGTTLGEDIGTLIADNARVPKVVPHGTGAVHAACGTMEDDADMANGELPTPRRPGDRLAVRRAYGLEGTAATECYNAGSTNKKLLAKAETATAKAEALYSRALIRIQSIDGRVPSTTTTTDNGPISIFG